MSPQHECNSTIAAFKVIALVLVLGVFAGFGYWYLESREPQGSSEGGIGAVTWPFISETLGLQFDVPDGWQITESFENGVSSELTYDENGNMVLDCKTHVELRANDIAFLVADDSGDCETPGRGGYWGDTADGVTSGERLEGWCGEGDTDDTAQCELMTNANGLRYASVHEDSFESWGDVLENVDSYYFYHDGYDWDGIVVSDEFFVQAGFIGDAELLNALVESLEFRP